VAHIPGSEQPQPRIGLTAARMALDKSQQEIADELGTTHVNVSRWERGITKPNPYFRRKLCKLFGKTEAELDLVVVLASTSTATSPQSARVNGQPTLPVTDPLPDLNELALYDPAIPLQPAIQLVGRDDDIARIKLRLCAGGNVALTALNGLPGVGKTALSIALVHDSDVREHFRDGILWAGLGPNANIPSLLSRWGTLLGISQTEMAALHGQEDWAKAIRSSIGLRTMLLVIDDAWDLMEALTFKVGGPNCAHLVTTRFRDIASHIAVGGATELQELSEEESMTLLRLLAPGVVEREVQKAQTLVQAVGGLPLALTLMGNYLRKQGYSGQTRRITSALERLGKAEERLHISEPHGPVETHPSLPGDMHLSLHSVIAVTDQLLSSETRQALYSLAVFPPKPNSFSEEAALAVIDCDVDNLDLLVDSSLLEYTASGRYTIHQTISDYARQHLQEKKPHRQLINFMIELVEEHKKDYELLDLESNIILRALDYAYELDMKEELVRAVIAFVPYMQARGSYDKAAQHLQRAHEAAETLNDTDNIITTLIYSGEIAQQQGNFGQAESTFQEGLKLARQIENKTQVSALLHNLGWVAQKQGEFRLADTYLQEGLTIAREIDDKERICGILKVLGLVALYSGNLVLSEDYLQEGLALAEQIGDSEQASRLLMNLGVAAGEQGKYAKAEIYFQQGLVLARQNGHREHISALLANLGAAITELGDYSRASTYFLEGLNIARQIEHREWTSVLLTNLGLAVRKQGNYADAEQYLQEGLDLARQIGIPPMIANALYECGNLYLDQKRIKDSESAFKEMFIVIPDGWQDLTALAQYGLARVAEIVGNRDEAKNLAELSANSLEKIGHHKANEVRSWRNMMEI
jgi:tetratricopeptide (TPR) repeat protein/transcriptional regulator with XRE-family HTH domain